MQNLSLFEVVSMDDSASKICPKKTFLSPGPTLGPTYLIIVDQIQVKLVSAQACIGKVFLQSIRATLNFSLSNYNPLKM